MAKRSINSDGLINGRKKNQHELDEKGGGGFFLNQLRHVTVRACVFLNVVCLVLLQVLQTSSSIKSSSAYQLVYDVKVFESSTMKKDKTEEKKEIGTIATNARYKFMSKLQLFLTTFPGGFEEVGDTLARSLEFFWPLDHLDLVVVLDEFDETNATAKRERKTNLTKQVESQFQYKQRFKNFEVKWNPRYENELYGKGWLLQQLLMMWADNFTDSAYIGFIDDDTVFTRAIDDYDLFDEQGRPRIIARYVSGDLGDKPPRLMSWFESAYWAFGNEPTSFNGMGYFPVIVKREHFAEVRQEIMKHHQFATFDELFQTMRKRRTPSQFLIFIHYLWNHRRDEYSWHIEPWMGEQFDGWQPVDEEAKKKYYYLDTRSVKEKNVTEAMLRPFHRSSMHAPYVLGKMGARQRRPQLVYEFLQSGYCYSQPVVPATELEGNNETTPTSSWTTFPATTDDGGINYVSANKFCRDRYDVWNDINEKNEWQWARYKSLWVKSFRRSCLEVHRERMIRNIPNGHVWDNNEVQKFFEPSTAQTTKQT